MFGIYHRMLLLRQEKSKDGLEQRLLKKNTIGHCMTICIAILNFSLNIVIMVKGIN